MRAVEAPKQNLLDRICRKLREGDAAKFVR